MNFEHTEERRLLADMVRRYVAEKYPLELRHAAVASPEGFSRERWREFAALGLIGAMFPEVAGGYGGAGADIAILFEELGRGLVVEPFLPSLMAGSILSEIYGRGDFLEGLSAGECIITLAHEEMESRYDLARVETAATADGDGWRLSGAKTVVLVGDVADWLVVSAKCAGETGIGLFLVKGDADGVTRRGYPTVDGMRAAEIQFDRVWLPGDALIVSPDQGLAVLERAVGAGILALSAESLGAMTAAVNLTVEYLKTRTQFGRAIGEFQALQHRLADMLIEVEQAKSSVINAASRLDAAKGERDWALSAAKAMVGRVGKLVSEEGVQMHGGIGMTWDYAVGHYAKRLVMIDHMLGDTDHHLMRAAALAGAAE